ncbi:MAG: AAA domain-containing protein [Calditrichae bacterium]|nr:AAA domain-containing protein [Calditrichia bacterium]
MIRGESGTGKELVAQSIHDLSPRSQKPFVTVNCAAIPDNLLESELFGHEKGAFTGADSTRRGKFEEASGGSVFLDEIGDMSLSTQAKLLRVLQNKEIYRLGSNDKITVDVRIIAATHQPLETMLEKREFREDLYYRLKGVQINLPSLRERRQDISLLTDHFLELFSRNKQNKIESISNDAMNTLIAYVWPGNVRELQRVLEAAMIFADSQDHEQIELEDLPTDILAPNILQKKKVPVSLPENFKLLEHLARIELSYVEEALRLSEGKKTEAWKLLGLNDRFSLTRRVKAIFKKYPGMEENFRLVKKLFGTK